jgi:hypothetical protein
VENKTLFIRDDKTGEIEITDYARQFYKELGLDPEEEAKKWEQTALRILNGGSSSTL